MIRGKFRKGVLGMLGIALAAAFAVTGCSGTTLNSQTGWTLVGKVVDANSRAGVAGVKVCVKVNADWTKFCATTKDGTVGSMPAQAKPKYDTGSTAGDFTITGLPYLSNPTPVIVQPTLASGYAQITTTVNFGGGAGAAGAAAGAANGQYDMTQITIDKGVTVNVFVISTDGAAGAATQVDTNGAPIYFATGALGDVNDVLATYVSGNHYTFTLPRSGTGTVALGIGNFLTIPPFKSASGLYYQGAATNVVWQDLTVEANPTINLSVTATSMVTPLRLVASNFVTRLDNSVVTSAGVPGAGASVTTNGLPKDGVIKLYLNLPITLVAPTSADATAAVSNPYVIALSYVDYFKKLTAAASGVTAAVTAAVDATDPALLTITPTATLVENQTYSFAGRVQAATDWANQPGTNNDTGTNLDTVTGLNNFYVWLTGAGSIGSSPAIQIDNANGWTAYAAGVKAASSTKMTNETTNTVGGAKTPYLLFPEMVWGTVRLINYPGTVYEFNAPKAIGGTLTYVNNNLVVTRAGVQITGIGTSFDTQLQIGDEVTDANNVVWKVISIDSPTSMVATSTNLAAVPNTATPGVTANITLREGYYVNGIVTTNIAGDTLTGSQRVAGTWVNDATTGDVLSIGSPATQQTILSVSNTAATPGFGREFVVSLAGAATTLTAAATRENSGKGFITTAGQDMPITVFGSWGGPAVLAASSVNAVDGVFATGDLTYSAGVVPVPNLYGSPVTGIVNTIFAATTPGSGFSTNALSLATSHANGACSGVTIATGAAGVLAAGTATLSGGAGCKSGDILAVVGGGTAPTLVNGVAFIQLLTVTAGAPTAGLPAAGGWQIMALAGTNAGSYANATYNTVLIGSYLNLVAATGAIDTANTGIQVGIAKTTGSGTVAIGNHLGTLGAAGSVITTNCGNTDVACFATPGTAGAIAGDVITVFNSNVGIAAAAAGLPAGASPAHGTIRITAVDQTTGRVSAGVVLSSGSNYPITGATAGLLSGAGVVATTGELIAPGGVMTHFPQIVLSGNPGAIGAAAANVVTLGSKYKRSITNDIQKFGGLQVDALNDYVLANGGLPADIAGLTYSIEYTAACGNGQAKAAGSGTAAANLAALTGAIAYLQSIDTANTFNVGGFDWTGSALICNMTNASMFGWAAGGAHGIKGPFNAYQVSDSTTGTPMQIRLDINVVDMEGNTYLAKDTNYDVH